ncbi:hypothetical protein EIK77_005922 [Talaromyces pinophilus]|nr:hypothetical protein EIK77_005922 [Talaromyces pinophilus]
MKTKAASTDKYDDTTGNYTQTVLVNGNTVSTLSTSDGHAQGWGSAVECAETNCGTVPAHSWINTKIILDVADPDYIDTLYKTSGVTGDMTTTDGGKTWTVSTINIPHAIRFSTTQKCVFVVGSMIYDVKMIDSYWLKQTTSIVESNIPSLQADILRLKTGSEIRLAWSILAWLGDSHGETVKENTMTLCLSFHWD